MSFESAIPDDTYSPPKKKFRQIRSVSFVGKETGLLKIAVAAHSIRGDAPLDFSPFFLLRSDWHLLRPLCVHYTSAVSVTT